MLKLAVVCLLLVRFFISLGNSAPVANSDCQAKRNLFLKTGVPPGKYIPVCKPNGSYMRIQNRGKEYFCVDKDGVEILGTTRQGKPDCSRTSKCQVNRTWFTDGRKPFAPKCNPDGTFQEVQCEPMYGVCFCVTPHEGRVLRGTVTNKTPNCQGAGQHTGSRWI